MNKYEGECSTIMSQDRSTSILSLNPLTNTLTSRMFMAFTVFSTEVKIYSSGWTEISQYTA